MTIQYRARLPRACTIIQESIPLEKRGVESVCVINKFLKVFIGNLGREGRAPQILEEAIKTVGPEVNDYVVLSRVYFVAKRGHQMPKRSQAG
jgi:hypothetical protein